MNRTIIALAVGALLLAAACSSNTATPATPTTTGASAAASSTAKPADTTAKPAGTKAPVKTSPVTKPANVEKVDRTKLPTKAQKADKVPGISQDQSDCIDFVILTTITETPSLADSDLSLAGVAGGSIVACVPQETLAKGITADIKSSSSGSSLTEAQLTCIEKNLATADPTGLAVLIGGIAIEELSIVKQAATELDAACGTSLAA